MEGLDPETLKYIMMSNWTLIGWNELNLSEAFNRSLLDTDPYENTISSAGNIINKYYLWVILAIGFPGNFATLITICRMRRLGPFIIYVAFLAVGDNLAISVKLLYYQLLYKKVNVGTAGCRLLQFVGHFLMTYCNWILVLMAVERLIAVKFPFKIQFQSFLTCRKAGIILFSMGLVIAGSSIPILWASTYTTIDSVCMNMKNNTELINVIHWTSAIVYALLPFSILVVCNILIVREIRLSFKLRSGFRSVNAIVTHKSGCDVSTQRQTMIMLFTTTFMFCFLHFPICALLVADSYWQPGEKSSVKYLCGQLARVLCDSNHALNFYLYIFSARKFRSHFVNLFRCSSNKGKRKIRLAHWQLRPVQPALS